ncbi:hypothetical protein [Methylobacter sp.]|uniref:hypothetical protein n=1 Tax=Methylobacter sp. TaxID=2051955 RepID=UPI002FDC9103
MGLTAFNRARREAAAQQKTGTEDSDNAKSVKKGKRNEKTADSPDASTSAAASDTADGQKS